MFKYTEKKLARDIGRVAESIDPSMSWEYLPASREVKLTSGDNNTSAPCTVFLGNLFLKVSELARKDRIPTIEAFLTELLTPRELSPAEILESLALRVRTEFELDLRGRHLALLGHDAPPSAHFRRGDLVVEIVSDREESVSVARTDDLAEIGVNADEAFRIAAAKLRRATGEEQWEAVDNSIWLSRYQDDYDFARLVAAEDAVKFPFDGMPIVFAPSHSICLASSSAHPDVLTRMVDIGNEFSASHRPFCQLLWTKGDGTEWRVWHSEADTAAAEVSHLQIMRENVRQYSESSEHLEQALGNEDIFIAAFQPIENDDGLSCYCVYPLDIPTYLPRADFVAIVDPALGENDNLVGRIDWKDFEEIVGLELLNPIDDMNPHWFRLVQPLDDGRKDQIRRVARPL